MIRALAVEPRILLLDEPFGALDAKVRKELRQWLRRLHEKMPITSILVTHDQEEALEVADRIVVLNEGRIVQEGSPEDVYENPATAFVYDFLGSVNLFHCRNSDERKHFERFIDKSEQSRISSESSLVAYVRPHDIEISRTYESGGIKAKIVHINATGALVKIQVSRLDTGEIVVAELTKTSYLNLNLKKEDIVFIYLRNPRVFSEDYVI